VLENKIEWLVVAASIVQLAAEGVVEVIEVGVRKAAGLLDGVAARKRRVVHEPQDAAAGRLGHAHVVCIELAEYAGR
jgi:hypothetical protein